MIFLATPRSEEARKAKEVSRYMLAGPAVIATICLLLGIFSFQIFSSQGYTLPIPNMMVIGLTLIVTSGLVWLIMRLVSNRTKRTSETWGCGITSQNSKMEYTASGFSEPILTIFRPIYRTQKKVERTYEDDGKSIFKDAKAEIQTFKLFEERIYLPIAHAVQGLSTFISDLHDVDLDTYILYSFAAVVILIVAAGWFI
jgi:hypothetical protein